MFFWGGGEEKESTEGFYHADCLVFLLTGWREKAPVTDYLIGVGQKIPHWQIKTIFLGDVETAIRSGSKTKFGITGFGTSDTMWGLWFTL